MPITAMEIALYRLGKTPTDKLTGDDFEKARIPMFGGCCRCAASIAAYNAFPGRNGYWHCDECIGDDDCHVGFSTVEAFERSTKGE